MTTKTPPFGGPQAIVAPLFCLALFACGAHQGSPSTVTGTTTAKPANATPAGVTNEELAWAEDLQAKVNAGYQPTREEIARYTDIYERWMAGERQKAKTKAEQPAANGPSAAEMAWASQLADMVRKGYQATDAEVARYKDIYERWEASQKKN